MHKPNQTKMGVLACPSELGAGNAGASYGVTELCDWISKEYELPVTYASVVNRVVQEQIVGFKNAEQVLQNLQSVYHEALRVFNSHEFTYVVSGDHSNALASFSAFSDLYSAEDSGLIWIDAHADLHTPFTSPSGNIHGMPLGALLGTGHTEQSVRNLSAESQHIWNRFKDLSKKNITPKLLPHNLLIVGLRDYEHQELELINQLSIQMITPEQWSSQSVDHSVEAVTKFASRCKHLYVSFDIDSLDASIVPGTGTPVSEGLLLEDSVALLKALKALDQCRVIEFTEYNPTLDVDSITQETVQKVLGSCLG